MKGREVVKVGLRWRISDSKKVRIWQDNLILGNLTYSFLPITPIQFLSAETTVESLFLRGTHV